MKIRSNLYHSSCVSGRICASVFSLSGEAFTGAGGVTFSIRADCSRTVCSFTRLSRER